MFKHVSLRIVSLLRLTLRPQKTAQAVRKLESEKAAIQREVDSAKKPLGPTTSSLVPKLRATSGKIDDINTLINLYENKWVRTTSSNRSLQDLSYCADLNCIKGCAACSRRTCQDTKVTCWNNFPCLSFLQSYSLYVSGEAAEERGRHCLWI